MELFRGHEGAHGTHGTPVRKPDSLKWEIKSTAQSLRQPPTIEMWEAHVAGTRPLGIIPVREDASCLWGSIDVDEYDVNLYTIIARIEQLNLPLVPCRSKSGGLHLFLFMREPVPAAAMQAVLRDLAAMLGKAGSEIFPKQTQILSERGDIGNWIVMPYFGQTYGGKIKEQVGLRKTGAELTASQFCDLADKNLLTEPELVALGSRRRNAPTKEQSESGETPAGGPFADGPPCLQHLADMGIAPGGQSNALLMMGVYFKKVDPANWKSLLEQANQELLKPPGSAEGLSSVMRSLDRKSYEYTCKTEPMVSHCNSALCRTRKYGVGDGGNFPIITGISKLDTEPPVWFVDIDDQRIEASTEQLQNYNLFHRLCMERVHKSYMMMKPSDWLSLLGSVMLNLTVIPAPPDVGTMGRFSELLSEFLTNRAKGLTKDDILSGRPWEDVDAERHYFRLSDFQKFLRREDMKELNRTQITLRIRKLEGADHQMTIKGRNVSCWFLPSMMVHATPKLDTPPVKESPI